MQAFAKKSCLIPNISLIIIYLILNQESPKLILKVLLPMMSMLVSDVRNNSINLSGVYRKCAIAVLPILGS
jgi:hypothetical protein